MFDDGDDCARESDFDISGPDPDSLVSGPAQLSLLAEPERAKFRISEAASSVPYLLDAPFSAAFDWDKGVNWTYFDGRVSHRVLRDRLLSGEFWQRFANSTVIVEKAHLMPRTERSKAQLYDQGELDTIARVTEASGVTIRLLPQSQAHRAREYTGLEKHQMAECNFRFYAAHRNIPLQAWPVKETPCKRALRDIRDDSTLWLDILRSNNYEHPLVDSALRIIGAAVGNPTRRASGAELIDKYFWDRTKRKYNAMRVMTVYLLAFDSGGRLRRNPRGDFIGIGTVWRAATLHAFKGSRSGTCRSNIMWHMMRSATKGLDREDWQPVRAEVRQAIKALVKVFRDYGLAAEAAGDIAA